MWNSTYTRIEFVKSGIYEARQTIFIILISITYSAVLHIVVYGFHVFWKHSLYVSKSEENMSDKPGYGPKLKH